MATTEVSAITFTEDGLASYPWFCEPKLSGTAAALNRWDDERAGNFRRARTRIQSGRLGTRCSLSASASVGLASLSLGQPFARHTLTLFDLPGG